MESSDVEALYDAMRSLIEELDLVRKLEANARQRVVELFASTNTSSGVVQLLTENSKP